MNAMKTGLMCGCGGQGWRGPLAVLIVGLFLAGCAPLETRQVPAPQPPPEPKPQVRATPLQAPEVRVEELPTEQAPPRTRQTSPAVMTLVQQADERRQVGDLAGAQSTLERAVQIEPGNARLWLDLAQLRLAQDQPEQAEQLALRAVEHARDNDILAAAWRLVAKARRAQGDEAGAREAEERAGHKATMNVGASLPA